MTRASEQPVSLSDEQFRQLELQARAYLCGRFEPLFSKMVRDQVEAADQLAIIAAVDADLRARCPTFEVGVIAIELPDRERVIRETVARMIDDVTEKVCRKLRRMLQTPQTIATVAGRRVSISKADGRVVVTEGDRCRRGVVVRDDQGVAVCVDLEAWQPA